MFWKRFFKISSISFLLFGITLFLKPYRQEKIMVKKIQKIRKDYEMTEYAKEPYLIFDTNRKEVLIKNDTLKKTLDQNYVGIWNENKKLEEIHNIVLAGHNIKSVFHILHELKTEDKILLYYKNYIWTYKVVLKETIMADNFSYFEESTDQRLTLITCTGDKKKRLIVVATLV